MTEFKRYRDGNGSEFSSAVSPELAESKGWKDITDDKHPGANSDGKPIPAKPAERKKATSKSTQSAATTASNDAKGA